MDFYTVEQKLFHLTEKNKQAKGIFFQEIQEQR